MKIKKVSFALLSFAFLSILNGYSQEFRQQKADSKFDRYEYINAIELYEKAVNSGYENTNTLAKIADAYYFNGKLQQANEWYSRLFKYVDINKEKLASEYYYRYAQTLRSLENYSEADKYMNIFVEKEEKDSRAKIFETSKDTYLKDIEKRSDRYELKAISINSSFSDYGATIFNDALIFTSARETPEKGGSKIHKWTNEAYTDLYASKIKIDGSFEDPILFYKGNAKNVNVSTAVFTKDRKTMYFTQNAPEIKDPTESKKFKNSPLNLYKVTIEEDGTFGSSEALSFNLKDVNTAHPALTPDEKWMYFVSDREGSIGQSDLFRIEIKEDGTFGKPENLGKQINTEGRETFPFITDDYMLYFSTDGRPGLGGLDIFMAKINSDGTFGNVINIGEPINSPSDDFSFYLNNKLKKGFISSNRTGGDDIYFFQEKQHVEYKHSIQGKVINQATNEPITTGLVTLYSATYSLIKSVPINKDGTYAIDELECCDTKYRIKFEADGFHTKEVVLTTNNEVIATYEIITELEPVKEIISDNDDLFKKLKLEKIYFDFDKANIRKDAEIELAKVVEVLKMYPTIKIDVRSHTDSRGSDSYNMKLSEKRAKSTMQWIIDQGIDKSRISGKGYGESELINDCVNNVKCTEKQHLENRRSEFIIVNYSQLNIQLFVLYWLRLLFLGYQQQSTYLKYFPDFRLF